MRFSTHEYALREFLITSSEGIRVLTPEESGQEALVGLTERQSGVAEKGASPLFPEASPEGERR
jgi:circadian clock protein KaiC